MSYLVLARKYRPRTFADVVGQEHAVRALTNALDHQRLHHAYLFTGTRGVGKTTLARILAACLNCETGVTSTPCGACNACTEIAAGRFIDLVEVDAASRTGVDDTRELLNNAQFLPGQGRYKVYLIDEVHMLTGHSFNALLKTLEEPPGHVKFLLATTEAKKIPVTVLSRCLQFNLKNMLPEVIEQQLAKVLGVEGIAAEPAALASIARAAAGSMRDALSIADQAVSHGGGGIDAASVNDMLGIAGRDEIGALLDALAARDVARLLAAGDDLGRRSLDLGAVLGELQRAFHELAMAAELGDPPQAPYQRFQDLFAAEDLQLYYQIALLGGRDLEFAPDAQVGFDMTLIRLASFEPAAVPADGRRGDTAAANAAPAKVARPDTPPAAPVARQPLAVAVADAAADPSPEHGTPTSDAEPNPPPVTTAGDAPVESATAEGITPLADAPVLAAKTGAPSAVDWYELVNAMAPAGATAVILNNSNLLSRDPGRWMILLDETQAPLLNDKQRREITSLVAALEGRDMVVDFETGKPVQETLAAREARLRAAEQAKARAMLMEDASVRALLSEFDGRLESALLRKSP